jgi:hypothetical protein
MHYLLLVRVMRFSTAQHTLKSHSMKHDIKTQHTTDFKTMQI